VPKVNANYLDEVWLYCHARRILCK